jgi:hypothetical protein
MQRHVTQRFRALRRLCPRHRRFSRADQATVLDLLKRAGGVLALTLHHPDIF